MTLSAELLDEIDGGEEFTPIDSRITRWADMARALEMNQLPQGLSLTCRDDGVWLHFEDDKGQKATFNIANLVLDSDPIMRMAVRGWVSRFMGDDGPCQACDDRGCKHCDARYTEGARNG